MIAFVNTNLVTCGGIITNFEYVKKLRERGYEANLYANEGNEALQKTYALEIHPLAELETLTDKDVIIANRWEQCEQLENLRGRKIQFVQGNDKLFYENHVDLPRLIQARTNPKWELIGVSDYCLEEWKRGTVIPNGINDRFFIQHNLERDIDALIEGNDEPNKNIDYAITQAKNDGHQKIVWLGRETHPVEGVECITNPPQEDIPYIYQRAKHFYKYSKSEGFCMPLAEAVVSGCTIHAHEMGGAHFKGLDFRWDTSVDLLIKYLNL